MITTPQELEQTVMVVANWVAYNNKPFALPAENGQKVYLCLLTEEEYARLTAPPAPTEESEED